MRRKTHTRARTKIVYLRIISFELKKKNMTSTRAASHFNKVYTTYVNRSVCRWLNQHSYASTLLCARVNTGVCNTFSLHLRSILLVENPRLFANDFPMRRKSLIIEVLVHLYALVKLRENPSLLGR